MVDKKEMINDISDALDQLKSDAYVPKNIKNKIEAIMKILSADEDMSLKVNKALNELDEISNDNNLQAFTRTQIWNIVSMLESI